MRNGASSGPAISPIAPAMRMVSSGSSGVHAARSASTAARWRCFMIDMSLRYLSAISGSPLSPRSERSFSTWPRIGMAW